MSSASSNIARNICPDATAWAPLVAVEIAERIRQKIEKLGFETDMGAMTLTCGFGVNEWEASDSIDRLLKWADRAIYEAKNSDRDRVIAADSALPR